MLCKIRPTGASDYLLKTSERNPEAVAIYRNVDNTETDGRAPPVCRRGGVVGSEEERVLLLLLPLPRRFAAILFPQSASDR